VHFLVLARVAALLLTSGSSVLVALCGWTETLLLSVSGKGREADLLLYLFTATMYTLAAIASLHGLVFWLDALGKARCSVPPS
jgi:hypothetical protein